MTLDEFTQTLDPALGLVQSNFGMLTGDQRRIAGQGLSQNNRVGRKAIQDDAQPIYRDQPQPAIQLPNQGRGMQQPIATDIQQQFRTLDPTTRELFFGSGIPGTSSYSPGFMQQAFRASEKTFYDEQGNPIVVPEQVAGLSPEQLAAINLSREKIGVQDPFLQQSHTGLWLRFRKLIRWLG
jgi:hypothetical protein